MRRCPNCKNTYPDDLFERFNDKCIVCMDKALKPTLPQPREETEWRDLGTIARINERFLRMGKAHR